MSSWTDTGELDEARAIAHGNHHDAFGFLGLHQKDSVFTVRAFMPGAKEARVVDAKNGRTLFTLTPMNDDGVFAGSIKGRKNPFAYRLLVVDGQGREEQIEDPYRFPPWLGDIDVHLLAEGNHFKSYEKLGAHPAKMDGVEGVAFAVWAPNARCVNVVGEFNQWNDRRHPMRLRHGCGVWEIFIPGAKVGQRYKFAIRDAAGNLLPLKADPYATATEVPPQTASVVSDQPAHRWTDDEWMAKRASRDPRAGPMSIYEVHLGSWRRSAGDNAVRPSYRELAEQLVPYVADMGFTHVEFLPVSEHPFEGSWGYQPSAMFAPTSRFGSPDDFRALVDAFHRAGIGVILDWVPGHFPKDAHLLGRFDGTGLYEHEDPRRGEHKQWGTFIYNYSRSEVANFLISNALFWLREFHIDGLRVDAVASMLYLDYDRAAGEWIPNAQGGNQNLEAVEFLKRLNTIVYREVPGIITIAEESTAWPMVSRPVDQGGLGFGFKWNMGWMHDTLEYMSHDPIHRRFHHNELTFGLVYAFSENFVLPLSHDEVVYGKHSLLGRMPGDRWQKFANLRAYYGFMFTHPGKKLLFMGGEFAQEHEWNHDAALDWQSLGDELHQGVQRLVRDLNRIHRELPAVHELDCESGGFEWIDGNDGDRSILAYLRRGKNARDVVVTVVNFTPVVREGYLLGVPEPGIYREILNSDAACYGGSNVGNDGAVTAKPAPSHGRAHSLEIRLPPLASVVFALQS
ncbi:MAG: 1,4-alpha-glucan branching protein GlgB [Alphaproteobacteria bacterium]|nr:1,4-alpha-glucan branching protein GlgB [Alphaproteobacteria bacterium]